MGLRLSGLMSGIDTDAVVEQLMSAQSMKKTKIENKKTKLEWKKEKWEDLNKKLYSLYTKQLSKLKMSSSYMTRKVTSSNESAVTATATSNAAMGSHTLEVKELASAQYVTGADILKGKKISTKLTEINPDLENKTIEVKNGDTTTTITIDADMTLEKFARKLQNAGLNATFDEKQGRFFISSKNSGTDNAFAIGAADGSEEATLNALGLTTIAKDTATGTKDIDPAADITKNVSIVKATDAEIVLDGATLTDSSNTFSVAGMTLELKGKTTQTMLNVSNDIDAVYNTIKDFFKEYNSILEEMNTLYNAGSAKGYEPLTDEEKEAMTEEQIKLWEDKIKGSLLRRDTTLGSLTDAMRNAMQSRVEVDGKNYSLSSFGIMTSVDYTERGLLHIYGDEDDDLYSDEDNKLKAALAADPEAVAQAMSKIMNNLSTTMMDKMKVTSLSSALTFYNDKQMKNQIEDYEDELDEWDDKLKEMEDRYYKQFTSMESAMAKLQSQSNYLASLMGTSAQ